MKLIKFVLWDAQSSRLRSPPPAPSLIPGKPGNTSQNCLPLWGMTVGCMEEKPSRGDLDRWASGKGYIPPEIREIKHKWQTPQTSEELVFVGVWRNDNFHSHWWWHTVGRPLRKQSDGIWWRWRGACPTLLPCGRCALGDAGVMDKSSDWGAQAASRATVGKTEENLPVHQERNGWIAVCLWDPYSAVTTNEQNIFFNIMLSEESKLQKSLFV